MVQAVFESDCLSASPPAKANFRYIHPRSNGNKGLFILAPRGHIYLSTTLFPAFFIWCSTQDKYGFADPVGTCVPNFHCAHVSSPFAEIFKDHLHKFAFVRESRFSISFVIPVKCEQNFSRNARHALYGQHTKRAGWNISTDEAPRSERLAAHRGSSGLTFIQQLTIWEESTHRWSDGDSPFHNAHEGH